MDGHKGNEATPTPSTDAPILNLQEALDRVDGDFELLKELIDIFLAESPTMMKGIEAAILAGDPTALQHAAHTLKGSVANFAAPRAVAASLALEQMGRHQDMENTTASFASLQQELERLTPVLLSLKEKEAA
jgi:HPt (histidine-containing phosphotransfer) domain-containing protein